MSHKPILTPIVEIKIPQGSSARMAQGLSVLLVSRPAVLSRHVLPRWPVCLPIGVSLSFFDYSSSLDTAYTCACASVNREHYCSTRIN
jgi:hypothetical protein